MRRNRTEEDKLLEKQIEDSLKVSSYIDQVYNQLENKVPIPSNIVPDYSDPYKKSNKGSSTANESNSLYNLDIFSVSADVLEKAGQLEQSLPYETKVASNNPVVGVKKRPNDRKISLSSRQQKAIQKYPALIEILGSDDGEKIVQDIVCKINELMVDKIAENSREINKNAQKCKSEKHNIKQYYVGDDDEWICTVVASGPFRGDEAFHYDKNKDVARILRKVIEDNNVGYKDVTSQFNIIHEILYKEVE